MYEDLSEWILLPWKTYIFLEVRSNIMLSIILPTYNRLYALREIFLPSLEKQSYRDYEIIIVDDGSSDGTETFLHSEKFQKEFPNISKRIEYIRNRENLGAPTSRNLGVEQAIGEWVWIVEDDIFCDDEDFLEKADHILRESPPDVAVVSPSLTNEQDAGVYHLPWDEVCRIGQYSGEIYLDATKRVDTLVESTHGAVFVRREVYLELGGQYEGLHGDTFRDESDFYARVRKDWYQIFFAGKGLTLTHRNLASESGWQRKMLLYSYIRRKYLMLRNHFIFLERNFSYPHLRIIAFFFVSLAKMMSIRINFHLLEKLCIKYRI